MKLPLLRTLVESILRESDAGDEADGLGLTHRGWGRYYDDEGNFVAKVVSGKLVRVKPDDPENENPDYQDAEDRLNADPDAPSKLHKAIQGRVSNHSKDDPEQVQQIQRFQKLHGIMTKMRDNGMDWDHLSPESQTQLKKLSTALQKEKDNASPAPYRSTMNKVVDWNKEERKARSMTSDELAYAAKDAQQASKASGRDNPNGEGYYSDLASVYGMELKRRQDGKSQEPTRSIPKGDYDSFVGSGGDKDAEFDKILLKHKDVLDRMKPHDSVGGDKDAEFDKILLKHKDVLDRMKPHDSVGGDEFGASWQDPTLDKFKSEPEDDYSMSDKPYPKLSSMVPDDIDDEELSRAEDDYHNNPSRYGPDQ